MRSLVLGLGVVLLAIPAGAAPRAEPFTSAEGHFRVGFPNKPRDNTQTADTPLGKLAVVTHTYATTEGNVYFVAYTDYPAAAVTPDTTNTLLDGVRDGLKKDGEVSEQPVMVGKLPGREVTVKQKKGTRLRVRLVLSGSRLYQVGTLGSPEFVGGRDATTFLDSFAITK